MSNIIKWFKNLSKTVKAVGYTVGALATLYGGYVGVMKWAEARVETEIEDEQFKEEVMMRLEAIQESDIEHAKWQQNFEQYVKDSFNAVHTRLDKADDERDRQYRMFMYELEHRGEVNQDIMLDMLEEIKKNGNGMSYNESEGPSSGSITEIENQILNSYQ